MSVDFRIESNNLSINFVSGEEKKEESAQDHTDTSKILRNKAGFNRATLDATLQKYTQKEEAEIKAKTIKIASSIVLEHQQKNLESIFRSALAAFELAFSECGFNLTYALSFDKKLEDYSKAAKAFKFVLQHAEKGSILSTVAQTRLDMIERRLQSNPKDQADLDKFREIEAKELLIQFSDNSNLKGKELRKKVYQILKSSPECQDVFYKKVIEMMECNPDVVLGKLKLEKKNIELVIPPHGEGQLDVQASYTNPDKTEGLFLHFI